MLPKICVHLSDTFLKTYSFSNDTLHKNQTQPSKLSIKQKKLLQKVQKKSFILDISTYILTRHSSH